MILGSKRQEALNSGEFDHKEESLMVVNSLFFSITSNEQSIIITLNSSIRLLYMKFYTWDNLLVKQKWKNNPSVIGLKNFKFLYHGLLPGWIRSIILLKMRLMHVQVSNRHLWINLERRKTRKNRRTYIICKVRRWGERLFF